MKNITKYNVLLYDFNTNKIIPYDIIPYLVKEYKEEKINKPKSWKEFINFVDRKSKYQFWGRCEYEIIMNSFPLSKEIKTDVYFQIQQNLELITQILLNKLKISL